MVSSHHLDCDQLPLQESEQRTHLAAECPEIDCVTCAHIFWLVLAAWLYTATGARKYSLLCA